jgi:hypothetical protein
MGAHPWGMHVVGGGAHFLGPTFTGMGMGCPMAPYIGCIWASTSPDHAAIRSAARVRTGAIRFLVMKFSFKQYIGNGWCSRYLPSHIALVIIIS